MLPFYNMDFISGWSPLDSVHFDSARLGVLCE